MNPAQQPPAPGQAWRRSPPWPACWPAVHAPRHGCRPGCSRAPQVSHAAPVAPTAPHLAPPAPLVPQSNAPILPIMLATKLLPEMEGEERELLAALAAEQQQPAGGGGGSADAPQLSLAEQFAWVQDQERELNHLIDALVREEEGLLGAKGPRRRELAAAAAQAAAAAPPAPPGLAGQGPLAVRPGGQQQAAPDPLLAAVAFGAGLA